MDDERRWAGRLGPGRDWSGTAGVPRPGPGRGRDGAAGAGARTGRHRRGRGRGAAGEARAERGKGRGGAAGGGARRGVVGRGQSRVDKTKEGGFVGVGVPRHDPRRGTPNPPAVMAGSSSAGGTSQAPRGGHTPPPCMAGCSVLAPSCMVAGPNGLVLKFFS